VFLVNSGSEAVDSAIRFVWYYNNARGRAEKKKIVSRWRGYHGSGVMTGSLTGLDLFHKAFDLPRAPILHTMAPHYYWGAEDGETEGDFARRCAAELDRLIETEGPDTVAAFIGEPVMGTGGIVTPPEGYWDEIQKVLAKHDVLLIADEVVTAFGRLGSYFGSNHYGIRPDIVTVAKGVSSGYAPISGSIVGDRVWKVLEEGSDRLGPIGHGWTYSAHPLCAAAANANLDIVDGEDLTGNARAVGGYFQERLRDTFAGHPIVGEVRGEGLLAALEFVAEPEKKARFDPSLKVGAKASAACLDEGLIARALPHGDILAFAPPLVITREEIDRVVEMTRTAVDRLAQEVR